MESIKSRIDSTFRPTRRQGLLTTFGLASALAWDRQTGRAAAQQPGSAVEIRIALSAGLDRLDPAKTANGPDLAIISQIYETLLELDPKTGQLLPNLAVSHQAKSPTVWEFKLRNDVKFHDGTPFTAADVKYSIERVLDPASAHYSQVITISKVEIIDDHTVEIHTKTPDPVIDRRMQPIGGTGRVFIVPKAYFEAHSAQEVNDRPVGTGPYKLETWRKGQSVTLTRNAEYWGPAPVIAKATFTFIVENSTRVNALLREEVDVIQRVPLQDVTRIERAANTHIAASPNGLVHTLILNTREPPFNDVNVRKAFAHAIDMRGIIGGLLGKYGRVLGVPMGPNVVQFDESIEPYKYDPALAKQLLGGRTIELKTYTSDGRYVNDREIYQAINAQLNAVGFKVTPQVMEWGRLIAMMGTRSAGPFYIVGWDFGERDASKVNSFLYSGARSSGTSSPEFDRLSAAAGQEMDPAKRTAIWKEAQRLVHDSYFIGATWEAAAIFGLSRKFDFAAEFGENLELARITLRASR